ncbi:MAG: septum formation protein Maf [Firmicutes bacterium]|nr:septum formation protein Maf [Bacillota bacterium]
MDIKDFKIILASGSPRRIEMLKAEGLEPEVIKSSCSETITLPLTPREYVMALAFRKGQSVWERLAAGSRDAGEGSCAPGPDEGGAPLLMISADTIVFKDGRIIGKPEDEADAFSILSGLRDAVNTVYTGVCLRAVGRKSSETRLFCARTDVRLGWYTDEYIDAYIASGEPMDKAGAYAIQGRFGENVLGIEGPRDNVIGFPLLVIKEELKNIGLI